jgi:hypothetical protein
MLKSTGGGRVPLPLPLVSTFSIAVSFIFFCFEFRIKQTAPDFIAQYRRVRHGRLFSHQITLTLFLVAIPSLPSFPFIFGSGHKKARR